MNLEQVSPHAPATVAQVILRGRPADVPKFAEYDRVYARQPEVLAAFGTYHANAGRGAEAAKYWKRWIDVSPDWQAYNKLADAYRAEGKDDLWEETLKASLEVEDTGLNHAQSNVKLAYGFIARDAYDKAEPYALAAADSWAGWALTCAAECEMGLKKWDRAEQFYRAAAGRYDEPAMDWFFASRMHGEMNPADAERAARNYVSRLAGPQPPAVAFRSGRFYLLTGDPKRAMDEFVRANATPLATDLNGLFVTLLADARAERTVSTDALVRVSGPSDTMIYKPIGLMLQRWYQAKALPDDTAVKVAIAKLPEAARPDADFFVGWYLANAGENDRAKAHWQALVTAGKGTPLLRTHAKAFLQKLQADGRLDLSPR
ncbi:tetratricopeptide repeat protein [Limnoglobus roseus]|uniref:Tetratricopeptide repeat-containing protein n=1 Tax=Limnoglobus roseus TaxID=2598579 RepID=A0A5C1AKE7_9BACT|nr:hypothetical protein [Limnoglobus roseus]QEL19370.1 tetratricopeptide repeat-containing protein [Limnoglobus roseus]